MGEDIKMPNESKNLFDIERIIEKEISFISSNDMHVIGIEVNTYTLNYLNNIGVYRFKTISNKNIPIIINDNLRNHEIKFNKEKNTEYSPYIKL